MEKTLRFILIYILLLSCKPLFSQDIFQLIENSEYEKVKAYSQNLNLCSSEGYTPVMWAIFKSDLKMLELLISKGADPKSRTIMNIYEESYVCGSNLVMAVWVGKKDIIDFLLKNKYFDINESEYDSHAENLKIGWNAIQTAAFKGDADMIRYLVQKGADLNSYAEPNENKTPLLMALEYNRLDAAKELIQLGADINIRDVNYVSSLDLALAADNRELVRLIYQKGFKFIEIPKEDYLPKLKSIFRINSFEQL